MIIALIERRKDLILKIHSRKNKQVYFRLYYDALCQYVRPHSLIRAFVDSVRRPCPARLFVEILIASILLNGFKAYLYPLGSQNPEYRYSRDEAHILIRHDISVYIKVLLSQIKISGHFEVEIMIVDCNCKTGSRV